MLAVFCFFLFSTRAFSQITISTESGTNYNGLSGVSATTTPTPCAVTFVIQNTNASSFTLKQVDSYCKTATSSSPGQNGTFQKLWYSAVSLSGPLAIGSPAWTLVGTGSTLSIPADGIYPVVTGLNFVIPAGTQYRFALESSNGVSYTSATSAPTPNTFTSAGISLKVHDAAISGAAVGYGGAFPSPANTPRAFTGRIVLCALTTPATTPVLSADTLLCGGGSATLLVRGGSLNNATAWKWHSGSCGGPVVGTGTSLTVSPSVTTTYYVRGEGGCASAPGSCASVTVTVRSTPGTPIVNTVAPVCNGAVAHLAINPIAFGNVPTPDSITITSPALNIPVPDNTGAGVSTSLTVPALPPGSKVTGIDVILNMVHTYPGDMIFNLAAPNGVVANLYKYNTGILTGNTGGLLNAGWFNTVTSSAATRQYSSLVTTTYNYGAGPYAPDLINGGVAGIVIQDPSGYTATAAAMSELYTTANGNWTLAMADGGVNDVGTLTKWAIKIRYNKYQQIAATPAVWTPSSSLFTDAAGTVAYDGTSARMDVYARPAVTTNYTLTSNNNGCLSAPVTTTVTVNNPVTIAMQPAAATVCNLGTASFTFTVNGSSLRYQWLEDKGTGFTRLTNNSNYSGVDTSTLTITGIPFSWNGYRYACHVTSAGACADSVVSDTVLLNVNPTPMVTLLAAPYTKLIPGLTTVLSVSSIPAAGSFNWFKNNAAFADATGNSYTASINSFGIYKVAIVDVNGCSDTSNVIEISDSVSGRLFIYPNPNNGHFNVSYHSVPGNILPRILMIYDSKAALVMNKTFKVGKPYDKMEVDLGILQKGIYAVVLLDNYGKRLASGKVVIQ